MVVVMMVVVAMVVMIVVAAVVVRIPTIAVWCVPIAVWTIPIVVWRHPAIIPIVRRDNGCTPRAKHRGYILRLYPHHITRDHHIVECRVVGRSIEECIGVTQCVVGRWHTIGRRREAIQATSIGALVAVCQHSIVGIEVGTALGNSDILLCRLSLDACKVRLVLSLLSLVLSLRQLRLRLLTLGYSSLVVYVIQIVGIGDTLPRSSTTRQQCHRGQNRKVCNNLSHSETTLLSQNERTPSFSICKYNTYIYKMGHEEPFSQKNRKYFHQTVGIKK